MRYSSPVPFEREDRRKVKSAADPSFDPHYGEKSEGQRIVGQSFADLRDEMNYRRRTAARREGC
jgi:hypothetical protein